jgi:hypothetical protein
MLPFIAALAASLLTILGSFGLTQHQATLRRREAREQERAAAYGDLLSRSLEILMRVRAVGEIMRLRSSGGKSSDLPLGGAEQIGLFEVFDWIVPAFQPFADAWSRVSASGSQMAVTAGSDLVLAIYDLLSTAVSPDPKRGWLLAFLDGKPWTGDQCSTYEAAVACVITYRSEFTMVLRGEFGAPPAQLPSHPRFYPHPRSRTCP